MSDTQVPLDPDSLRAANVNPETGLATDFLNPYNEYIMLAEMVADGSMEPEVLAEWQPIDYESHFVAAGFAGAKTVLAAFRALTPGAHAHFEDAVNFLIDAILEHQALAATIAGDISEIRHHRDHVAAIISGPAAEAKPHTDDETQAAIDALFD